MLIGTIVCICLEISLVGNGISIFGVVGTIKKLRIIPKRDADYYEQN